MHSTYPGRALPLLSLPPDAWQPVGQRSCCGKTPSSGQDSLSLLTAGPLLGASLRRGPLSAKLPAMPGDTGTPSRTLTESGGAGQRFSTSTETGRTDSVPSEAGVALRRSPDRQPLPRHIMARNGPAEPDTRRKVRLGNYVEKTPFHEGAFVRWKTRLGAGAFNEVWQGEFRIGGKLVDVAVKFPVNAVSRTASLLGIPHDRPDFGLRNIAMSRINQKLGWNIIPATALCQLNGKTGIVMTLAEGKSPAAAGAGLPTVAMNQNTGSHVQSMLLMMRHMGADHGGSSLQVNRALRKLGMMASHTGHVLLPSLPTPRLRHPLGAAELVKLQLLDLLCAQADRHANNYLVDADSARDTLVQGIDNDQAFGHRIIHLTQIVDEPWAKLPGLPQIIDTAIYNAIMRLSGGDLAVLLNRLLPPQEIRAAQSRLKELQQHLIRLRQAGRVIHPDDWDRVSMHDLRSSYFARDFG